MPASERTTGEDSARRWPAGWHVSVTDETGSTNADLLARAAAGAPDRTVLCARHQTAGRGRLDRRWDAPPGTNLLVSLLLRDDATSPHVVTQRLACAAARACVAVADVEPMLKWPNDLLLDGRKLAGMLAQAGGAGGRVDYVVAGLGLNVGWAPADAARLGEGIDPLDVLTATLLAYDELGAPGADVHGEYRRRLATLGQRVRIDLGTSHVDGVALGVRDGGQIVIRTDDGQEHEFTAGDVVHLRPLQ